MFCMMWEKYFQVDLPSDNSVIDSDGVSFLVKKEAVVLEARRL